MTQQLEHRHTETSEPTEVDKILDEAGAGPLDAVASEEVDDFRRRRIREVMAHSTGNAPPSLSSTRSPEPPRRLHRSRG